MQPVRPAPTSLPRARAEATFFNQVYFWMAVGLAVTGAMAFYTLSNITLLKFAASNYMMLAIVELAVVFGLSFAIGKLSGMQATLAFMVYSLLNGLTLSVILAVYTGESIASTFFITAGMFAAAGSFGYFTKRDLSGFGRFLFMGLIGILIASIVNIFMQSSAMQWTISVIGVFVFAGLTAYDHQKLREMSYALQEMGERDGNNVRRLVILGALTLYLDFINLFIMLLRFFGDRR